MDTTAALHNRLTDDERRQFEDEGYLIVRDALTPDQVGVLTRHVDHVWEGEKEKGLDQNENLFYPNFAGSEQAYIDLLDLPTTFPKVAQILGWNIYLYHSHLGVTPQEAPKSERSKPLGFHQDSGRVNADMAECEPRPRVSLKVAYWLSDISEPNRGNFWIVPGKHKQNSLDVPEDGIPDGAMEVCCSAGDAVFFDRRLWHSRSPNHSPVVRKVLFYGYGYRWLRTKDDTTIRPDLFLACDPIRKQLLGAGTNCNGHFTPQDEDVPLKAWMVENGLSEEG